jgi:glycosyltransferase involved in cell wall biosynthesis
MSISSKEKTDAPRKVICFGPGPVFKGGLSNYNTSLAKAIAAQPNTEVQIVSWTQQYPSIIPREFKDKTSKMDFLEGTNIKCEYITNFNNPFSWRRTANYIAAQNPEVVVFQWSIALQGLPLGSVIRRLKKICKAEIIMDMHFVVQKEKSKIDRYFTKRGIRCADSYIVHALKTFNELKELLPEYKYNLSEEGVRSKNKDEKNVIKLYHPIYDLFQPRADFDIEAFKQKHGLRKHVFLFFGFIRQYKGLHQAIEAFAKIAKQRDDVSLLIAGESFWNTLDSTSWTTKIKQFLFGIAKKLFVSSQDDERNYKPLELIEQLGIADRVAVFNEFIPNERVHEFFQVSDCVVLYYLTATPSGVESLSYNFQLPILATKVGHFPETVVDGYNGYLAEDRDTDSMAAQMLRFVEQPIPRSNVAETSKKLSWANYAKAILNR